MTTLREQNMRHKGIIKKNLRPRCSITDPFETFWPLLDPENSKILINEMEKTISKENGKLKLDWFTLKKLPLDVRKCQIKDLANKHKLVSSTLKTQRIFLKTGINEVSRCIEKNQIACCLIAEDVADCMLSKHLLLMTAAKKIPTIVLPSMRIVTKDILGFSSAALGLKKDVLNETNSALRNLCQTIIQFSSQFRNPYLNQTIIREPKAVAKQLVLNVDLKDYLLKKPKNGRAFTPEGVSNITTINDLSFIPIEKMVVEEQMPYKHSEKLFEIPTSKIEFSIDTKPLDINDIGESVERKAKSSKEPMRYYGLKMKKMKPNSKRKHKGEENTNTINE